MSQRELDFPAEAALVIFITPDQWPHLQEREKETLRSEIRLELCLFSGICLRRS